MRRAVLPRRWRATKGYQKIRCGLSLGVLTYWQNYRFLFEGPDAAPLKRWAIRFGYPVD